MIHPILDEPLAHSIEDLSEDTGLHDGEGHHLPSLLDALSDLPVSQSNYACAVDLNDLLVSEETVPSDVDVIIEIRDCNRVSPCLAAELLTAMAATRPAFTFTPSLPARSLWRRRLRARGLSLTPSTMLLTGELLSRQCTQSAPLPASSVLPRVSSWSPNLRPAMAAGLPGTTRTTKTPLL